MTRFRGTLLVALLSLFGSSLHAQDAGNFIEKMYNRYHNSWNKTLTFKQETQRFRDDTLAITETWYEAIVYPNFFRIDFGEFTDGNHIIYRNDSAYVFHENKRIRARTEKNDLLFLLGGMYSEPSADAVREKLAAFGFDWHKAYRTKWKGHKVMVIGASGASDTNSSQLWIDTRNYTLLRSLKYVPGRNEEGIFTGHKKYGNAYVESDVTFYINGKLVQHEKYSNIRVNDPVNPELFRPY